MKNTPTGSGSGCVEQSRTAHNLRTQDKIGTDYRENKVENTVLASLWCL